MDYNKLREEPLKSAVREDFFKAYKYTQIGNIDFVIAKHNTEQGQRSLFEDLEESACNKGHTSKGLKPLAGMSYQDDLKSILWAEAKQGTTHDIYESFVQLILTIGKEKTFEKYLPPKYIGAFDAEKIAFIEYHEIQAIFYQNDFNWNVTPSNHESKEFKQLHDLSEKLLQENSILFRYESQASELREFIRLNFKTDKDISEKISVTKNNFTFVFQKWSETVKPTISVDWEKAKKAGIISADFFLADLLSSENESLKDSLYVVLKKTQYELAKKIDEMGLVSTSSVGFNDRQKAYKEFWSIYARPPKEEYWGYIIERRDLLVPQDIRERKGSFFTPQIWVEKSQQYLADVLGDGWQDEYYIWDCCAGTGNLLNGLSNYRNVFASTLDKQDVDVMTDRIANGWNMFENHVFQFDFLNDEFLPQAPETIDKSANKGLKPLAKDEGAHSSTLSEVRSTLRETSLTSRKSSLTSSNAPLKKGKLPNELYEILMDEEKRKKLVIYINPPYAEASNKRTTTGSGQNRQGLSDTKVREKYLDSVGRSINELFAQFLIRVNAEIQCCKLAQFATLKALCAPNFAKFRDVFKAKLEKSFIVPANTFDNVTGQFPIGFFIWDNSVPEKFVETETDVYDSNGNFLQTKKLVAVSDKHIINKWLHQYFDNDGEKIGWLRFVPNDFQNNGGVYITAKPNESDVRESRVTGITQKNVLIIAMYVAIRHSIEATWLNDRDQFLFPQDGWQADREFQTDCLIYTLFHGQNRISSEHGINHWIPFTEQQVGCKKAFKSTFMSDFLRDFLAGKIDVSAISQHDTAGDLFTAVGVKGATPLVVLGKGGGLGEENPRFESRGVVLPQKTGGEGDSPQNLSAEAGAVYDAGLELWKYYHAQGGANPDASFYDIRRHFQGETKGRGKARMNNDSADEKYMELVGDLREKQKVLAERIAAKVYEYGFLK